MADAQVTTWNEEGGFSARTRMGETHQPDKCFQHELSEEETFLGCG